MDNSNLIISFTKGSELTYSRQFNSVQEEKLKDRINSVIHSIEENNENFNQLELAIQASGNMTIKLGLADRKVILDLDSNSKIKKEVESLLFLINELGVFSSVASLVTHHQFASIQKSSIDSSLLQRVQNFFQRFWNYYTFVSPSIKMDIEDKLKNQTEEELKNLYIDNQNFFQSLKENLLSKNPSLKELFAEEEIEILINQQFIQETNQILKKEKKMIWTQKELYQLDVLRLIQNLKTESLFDQSKDALLKINPFDISLKSLSEVSNSSHSKELVDLWEHILGNLFYKGRLDQLTERTDTRNTLTQITYAIRYLEALDHVPNEINDDPKFTQFLQNLENQMDTLSIQDFLIERTVFLNIPFKTEDIQLQLEQEIYQQKIKPAFVELINKVSTPLDASLIINYLAQAEDSAEEVNKLVESISLSLTEKEKDSFKPSTIKDFLYRELERIAIFHYSLDSLQIQNIRQFVDQNRKEDVMNDILSFEMRALQVFQVPSYPIVDKKTF